MYVVVLTSGHPAYSRLVVLVTLLYENRCICSYLAMSLAKNGLKLVQSLQRAHLHPNHNLTLVFIWPPPAQAVAENKA